MEHEISSIRIEKSTDGNNVPYVEISINPSHPLDEASDFYISFRRYPKRVFVGVEDYRGDMSSGADLEDCWTAPTHIIEKTPINEFDPHKAFIRALTYLGEIQNSSDPNESYNADLDIWNDVYSDIESKIKEWERA